MLSHANSYWFWGHRSSSANQGKRVSASCLMTSNNPLESLLPLSWRLSGHKELGPLFSDQDATLIDSGQLTTESGMGLARPDNRVHMFSFSIPLIPVS